VQTTHQKVTLTAAGTAAESAVFEFGRGLPEPCGGWLLTLAVTNAHATSRVQAEVGAWDGLRQSDGAQVFEAGAADLLDGAVRVFVPWSAVKVTLSNAGTNGADVVARGVAVPFGASWPQARYLYNRGTAASVATGGAFTQYAVPAGATHYRPAWEADLGKYTVQERIGLGGAAQAEYSNTTTDTADSRKWVPMSVNETPGADRQIALAQSSGGNEDARVEFQIDLWGGMS